MRTLTAIAIVACLAACGGRSEPPAPIGEGPAALRQAPATSSLAGATYRMETFLWRDFMPGPDAGPSGRPLIAAVRVATVDGAAFPAGVKVDQLWVVKGDEVWRTVPREEQPRGSYGPATIEVVGREGPRWGPGITVDVVVRLREPGGATTLLRAAAQPINRTD